MLTTPCIGAALFPGVLAGCAERHPGVRVALSEQSWHDVERRFLADSVVVAVLPRSRHPLPPGLHERLLWRERMQVVVPRRPRAGRAGGPVPLGRAGARTRCVVCGCRGDVEPEMLALLAERGSPCSPGRPSTPRRPLVAMARGRRRRRRGQRGGAAHADTAGLAVLDIDDPDWSARSPPTGTTCCSAPRSGGRCTAPCWTRRCRAGADRAVGATGVAGSGAGDRGRRGGRVGGHLAAAAPDSRRRRVRDAEDTMAPVRRPAARTRGAARPARRGARRAAAGRADPGPAGIGKTALIEHFLREPGVGATPVVVRASGEETEALLAYGVVEQLARSAGAAGRPAARRACRRADDRRSTTRSRSGTRFLELLDRLGAAAPVVLSSTTRTGRTGRRCRR